MKNSEYYISSDTLDTLVSEDKARSTSSSPLQMEEITNDIESPHYNGSIFDEENLVESEEDDDNCYFIGGMIFPSLDGTIESSPPYGGYGARSRGISEESSDSIDLPINKTALRNSPISTAVSMSPPDRNMTCLSNCRESKTEDNARQAEWYLELIQSIRNEPPELIETDLNVPSLRDLIYGANHLYPGEVINLANLFGPSI